MILVAFFGNYLVNNVAAGLASLVPATSGSTSMFTSQYITFVAIAAVMLGVVAWWYLMKASHAGALMQGLVFGIVGFVVAIATAFVTGVASVLLQTGSFSQVISVLPNFGPYLINKTTIVLLGLWIVPALVVGWLMQSKMMKSGGGIPRPMI